LQAVLEEKSDQLYSIMLSLTAAGRDALLAAHTEKQQQLPPQLAAHTEQQQLPQQLAALFHLEATRFHTLFHEVREMVRATEEAAACAGLSVKDTGALGKRTKYQVIVLRSTYLQINRIRIQEGKSDQLKLTNFIF
jgi:hypothetical protein